MAKRIIGTTPKQDGYRMPAEFEPQQGVWMLWPERNDNWRDGGKPAQKAFADVAKAIAKFEKVTVGASVRQYQIARKICEIADVDSYRTEGFVLEGGSIHVDGEGTVLTTEMCLLSEGRNPDKSKEEIEQMLCNYLGCEKVLWIKDGIDPDETNGHIDDVACFIAPGEVACIWTEDKDHPFYEQAQAAYKFLSEATDAKGRKLKVHKLCLTKKPCLLEGADTIDAVEGTIPREDGEVSIASYMNFLIVNGAVILPQYGDENDAVAIEQVRKMFPDREVVGVQTKEVAFGGGNIHCITQQQPAVKK